MKLFSGTLDDKKKSTKKKEKKAAVKQPAAKSYNYGKSVISSKLRYKFDDKNPKYATIIKEFSFQVTVYCARKKVYFADKTYHNTSINVAIRDMFKEKLEKNFEFEKGKNYYISFEAFKLTPIARWHYEKTDTKIKTERRLYLFRERINIYL